MSKKRILGTDSIAAAAGYYVSETPAANVFKVTLPAGELLHKRFKVERLLGQGQLSRVYLVRDMVRSEPVALKVVGLLSGTAANRLVQEMRQHSRVLDLHHVIQVYEPYLIPYGGVTLACMSMEYAEGGSFRDWLHRSKGRVDVRRSEGLEYFKQACAGVRTLHGAGIVHGDLKPENLLFVNGVLKVADLSLSRFVEQAVPTRGGAPGLPAGTPPYMSPEQIAAHYHNGMGFAADIYALGVILFEIMDSRGQLPFTGSPTQIYQGHLKKRVPSLDDLGPREARVIARCLQKEPAARYADIDELLADLDAEPVVGTLVSSEDREHLARQRRIVELWEQACQAFTSGNLEEAARVCGAVLKADPNHDDAQSLFAQIQRRHATAQQLYETIERNIGHQPLDHVNRLLVEAARTYPGHPRGCIVQAQLRSIGRQYRDAMSRGAQAFRQGHWDLAASCFERARQLDPGEPTVERLVRLVAEARHQAEISRDKIDAALEQGNRHKALTIARALDRYIERTEQWIAPLHLDRGS